jgi:HEAT repeat protein
MNQLAKFTLAAILVSTSTSGFSQDTASDDDEEQLKLAALEALMHAPPERALPIVTKVLNGNHSDEVKSRALFVLGQLDDGAANELLISIASSSTGDLQLEAIRMIGISGEPGTMGGLVAIYQAGDMEVKESVLHAFMIADDADSVFEIANNATDDEEFETAVQMLGMMGAVEHLSRLRNRDGSSESLIHAYVMAGDYESIHVMALNSDDPETQMQAIHGLGMVGGEEVGSALVEIFRASDNKEVREAAMHGLMMSDDDDSIVLLYRESSSTKEKADLLRLLTMMDSDAALDMIDEAFSGDR